jgi:3-dehydroquinate dehydratase-2
MLGIREPEIYGSQTYDNLIDYLNELKTEFNINLEVYQYNYEGDIINRIQEAYFNKVDAIIINPAAFTHYSYAIYDTIKAVNIKTVEVHLSDIYNREDFRKINVIKDACVKSFYGKGFISYREAIEFLIGDGK